MVAANIDELEVRLKPDPIDDSGRMQTPSGFRQVATVGSAFRRTLV
jgi:hypothetical protein